MTFYFAYGTNMSTALMKRKCRDAKALGVACLVGWRFVISIDGYASIVPEPGAIVYGVLWKLCARDRAALDAYEDVGSGLYRRRMLPIRYRRRVVSALVYLGREGIGSHAKPDYQKTVIEAAQEWCLPKRYIAELRRWLYPVH
jgi:Gamma-glutamyl cyclotransferase, AIG2-like